MRIGSALREHGICEFTVWAPLARTMSLRLAAPEERLVPMERDEQGYWHASIDGVRPGTRYRYRIDEERERPDPASHFQPEGVHAWSQVVDHAAFQWDEGEYPGFFLPEAVIYELHAGTFTPEGTFDAVIPRLDALKAIGVTALEVMPVSQYPGSRNWGYDGVYPFAVQHSYGGPEGLKRLVNECHRRGIALILDVVYNHFGPEGCYLRDYGPYFTGKYHTPWGDAVNFDDAWSDDVRNYFFENALHWFREYRIDALRLDAIHAIVDMSARPFLQELSERIDDFSLRAGRKHYLIAESDLNDARVTRERDRGGFGMDAQWCDDFHHAVHALVTGEQRGYYRDFGRVEDLARSFREGFVYSGRFSEYRKRRFGNASLEMPAQRFVVFAQNHDQVGNRMLGERLSNLVSFEARKLVAGVAALSPYVPLLFMGEEYGEEAPFLYFVSHGDAALIEAVRKGRKEEFKEFEWHEEFPDPQDPETFARSKLAWERRDSGAGRTMLGLYTELFRLRRATPALAALDKEALDVSGFEAERLLLLRRRHGDSRVLCVFNFNTDDVRLPFALEGSGYRLLIDSASRRWDGPGTLLPETPEGGEARMRGSSFAVFGTGPVNDRPDERGVS